MQHVDLVFPIHTIQLENRVMADAKELEMKFLTDTPSDISLVWRHLTYGFGQKSWFQSDNKTKTIPSAQHAIVKNQSGYIRSGELVAIIGPSGAGKTTFLECLTGRRQRGLHGTVYVAGGSRSTTLAFVTQDDFLLGRLTVRETLTFAAKFKAHARNPIELVNSVLDQLNMTTCASQLAYRCSGGQRKRLSIGIELISKPRILALDEPTSGLDSSSALHCVQFLERLATDNRLAIIASIHQPSASLLSIFHKVIILSHNGHLIYFGNVDKLHPHLASQGFNCPPLHNISDYAIELASGVHGQDAITKLSDVAQATVDQLPLALPVDDSHDDESLDRDDDEVTNSVMMETQVNVKVTKIIARMHRATRAGFMRHLWLLTHRTLLVTHCANRG